MTHLSLTKVICVHPMFYLHAPVNCITRQLTQIHSIVGTSVRSVPLLMCDQIYGWASLSQMMINDEICVSFLHDGEICNPPNAVICPYMHDCKMLIIPPVQTVPFCA